MKNLSTNNIRSAFIDYFIKNGHEPVKASSIIPHNDPSLMFVNSGMVQFKNVFTGVEQRDYTRAVTSQKSVRAGGKHNDLDNVGYTARHHTFFEMLGNFSFGDYFKEESIYYAWDLLTKEFGVPKDKLYVTIFHTDTEAENYWKKISGFGDDKIIKIKTNDNFWSMGDTGPCGPCSEIFYDHGENIPGGLPGTPEEDGDRYVEIWNMVFMQYEQISKDKRIDLPNKSIDTGMGLERIAAVLQNVHNNYDIDLFHDIIKSSEELTKTKSEGDAKFSHRIIADHLRSMTFLISDGVMPSNEGRGYVLRRIMRRAMRHVHILGAKDPIMHKMLPTLTSIMGEAYPDLISKQDYISDIIFREEERFKRTLDRGLKLLEEETTSLQKGSKLAGNTAFKLYDTYGFPLDLTEDILKNRGISVDQKGFDEQMNEQKERARKAWSGSGEAKLDNLWFEIQAEHGATEFVGYSHDEAQANAVSLVKDGKLEKKIEGNKTKFTLITNQTPFYGESGGQMGDIGTCVSDNCKIKIVDTKKYLGKIHAHICILESGYINIGDAVTLKIDSEYRNRLRANHTSTHILHAVLREFLGNHVAQKGSLVASDRFRFDFSHPSALSLSDKSKIEDRVNSIILGNSLVKTALMQSEEAVKAGAMALFGEKYDDEVRVVSLGDGYSVELCGGTHVNRTGDIGAFKILSEAAIASGVRRIEVITGTAVIEHARSGDEMIANLSELLKTSRGEMLEKAESLVNSKKALEKELKSLKMASLSFTKDRIEKEEIKISDKLSLIVDVVDDGDPKIMREAAESASKLSDKLIVVLASSDPSKISLVASVSGQIANDHNASNLVKEIASKIGLKGGGGSPTLAQAGGVSNFDLKGLKEVVKDIV
jgi:alanyl-tRNA synthetase